MRSDRVGLVWSHLFSAIIVVVALSVTAHAAPDSNCWLTYKTRVMHWPTARTVPVFVSANSQQGVQVVGYNVAFVEQATRTAIARWNEQGGSRTRLKWAGVTTEKSGTKALANAIVVVNALANGCATLVGSGIPSSGSDEIIDSATLRLWGSLAGTCTTMPSTDQQQDPGGFVDIMVHELGHTLGRNDAYDKPESPYACTSFSGNQCGKTHDTVMCSSSQDLTDFDRTEQQAVYSDRTTTTTLMRRKIEVPGTTWGPVINEGMDAWDVAPGPASSYQFPEIPVTIIHMVGAIIVHNFNYFGWWTGDFPVSSAYVPRKPVSTSFSPGGSGIMAYVVEDASIRFRRVCYRINYSAAWQPESCTNGCGPLRNSISTAYDPGSGRFLAAYQCVDDSITIIAFAVPNCTAPSCQEVSTTIYDVDAAETPVIACGNENYTAGGTQQLYSNCRLVYARRNLIGQPIAWRLLGVVPDFNPFGPSGPPSFWISEEHSTAIESDHAPAVTWFIDRFYMALSIDDSQIETYTMASNQAGWVWTATLNSDATATPGWISPPFMSALRACTPGCINQLHLFWFKYTTPPCTSSATPSPCAP